MLHIRQILPSRGELKAFARFPLTLHEKDPHYIQLPVAQQVRWLLGRHNAMMANGVQSFLMAYDDEKPVGRVLAGIDFRVMQQAGGRRGYISLFECVDDQAVANVLFDGAKAFLKLNGITEIVGPTAPAFDDFGEGLLVRGFETDPAFLSPANPPYYEKLFLGAGFIPFRDRFTYDLPIRELADNRYESVLRRAEKRFGFRVENVNVKRDLKRRSREMARVALESTPPEWGAKAPTAESLYRELKSIRGVLWPDFILMAYAGARPVGLLLAVPDCNSVYKGLGGHMFPRGTWRMLFLRAYVKRLRTLMLYVVPEYQNKGVEAVMIQRALDACRQTDIAGVEAAMIDARNLKARLGVERLGAKLSKVHRQFLLTEV